MGTEQGTGSGVPACQLSPWLCWLGAGQGTWLLQPSPGGFFTFPEHCKTVVLSREMPAVLSRLSGYFP